jgi:formylglycine-generating enzyme
MVARTSRVGIFLVVAMALTVTAAHGEGPPAGMVAVGPRKVKVFDPPRPEDSDVQVARFFLDKVPVTNREFLAFVGAHAKWRRHTVKRLFADDHYLGQWASPTTLGPNAPEAAPVVRVSWFAAKAYCEARGARLPTENEWELAAAADEKGPLADPEQRRREVLAWYGVPTVQSLPAVGKGKPNFWGVHDLHGLIWEWVLDFNNRVVGDGRRTDEAFVCGGSSLRGSDKADYPTYMRVAFRASLRGAYTTANLGFRCAADPKEATP